MFDQVLGMYSEAHASSGGAGVGGACCLQVTGTLETVLYRKRPMASKAQDQWTVPQWVLELMHHHPPSLPRECLWLHCQSLHTRQGTVQLPRGPSQYALPNPIPPEPDIQGQIRDRTEAILTLRSQHSALDVEQRSEAGLCLW